MNVDDAIRKGSYEVRREEAHITGKDDQINRALLQHPYHLGIVLCANSSLRRNQLSVQTSPFGRLQTGSVSTVGDHNRDFSVKPSCLNGIRNGLEIRAASGKQDPNFFQAR